MRLAVLGAGGHGRVVADSAAALGWECSFFDDVLTGQFDGWRVEGNTSTLLTLVDQFDGVIVAIGNNRARLDWMGRLATAGARTATIVDPNSRVSPWATVGNGSFLAPGSIVNIGAIIGAGCIINTAASVDHHCHLADGVHLSPGVHLSGAVRIGEASWLGTGVCVRDNVTIGSNSVIGVGSAIVENIPDGQTVVGVPGRVWRK